MSLEDIHKKRLPVEVVPVPGIGKVRIKRLSAEEINALPEDKAGMHQVQATILKDGNDEPFYADAKAAGADGAVFNALLKASNKVHSLELEKAEGN